MEMMGSTGAAKRSPNAGAQCRSLRSSRHFRLGPVSPEIPVLCGRRFSAGASFDTVTPVVNTT